MFRTLDPMGGFETMMKKVNEFTKELEKGVTIETGGYNPRVDIFENDTNIFVTVEIAGIAKEDVNVKINDENVLTIKGTKKRVEGETPRTLLRSERAFGDFQRSFMLPDYVDVNNVKAAYKDGILELTIGKKIPEAPKEYNINID